MKNILIIGAGKGIGLACAWKLRENNLITVSRHETPELAALNTIFIPLDVVKDSLETLEVPEVLYGLTYCPGSIVLKPFQRFTEDDYRADFEQNFIGAVKVIHKCLSALKKADGSSIVLFSTVAANWEYLSTHQFLPARALSKVWQKVWRQKLLCKKFA